MLCAPVAVGDHTVDLAALRRALTAAAVDEMPDTGIPWEGPIMGLRFPTGDARIWERADWRDLPLSLTINHDGVTDVIGSVDTIEERPYTPSLTATQQRVLEVAGIDGDPAVLWGTGTIGAGLGPRQAALALEVVNMIAAGALRGVSVEVTDIDMEYLIELDREGMDDAPLGYVRIPYGADVMLFRQSRVGALSVVTLPAFGDAQITVDLPGAAPMEEPDDEDPDDEAAAVPERLWAFTAAVSGGDRHPPLSAFQMPEADQPTPITVTEGRRIFGHIALWDSCHRGISGSCEPPPRSPSQYAEFMLGGQRTAEGHIAAVGRITIGGLHADTYRPDGSVVSAEEARRHYEDNATGVARAAAIDGLFGPWICGIIPDHVTDEQIDELLSCPPSGDWREIAGRPLGELDMIACHAVNNPGYPVPRPRVASVACDECDGGQQVRALVASVSAIDLWEQAHAGRRPVLAADLAVVLDRVAEVAGRLASVEATVRALGLDDDAAAALRARL
jgi:hypothetical protein